MSWTDRLGDAWGELSGAATATLEFAENTPGISLLTAPLQLLRAPTGLAADIATAPWNDDEEYNGFLNTLLARFSQRFAEDPAHTVGNTLGPALEGYYWLWSNAVSQPSVTASMVTQQALTDPSAIFSSDAWSSAYREAEHVSPGQFWQSRAAQIAHQILPGQQGLESLDLSTEKGVKAAVAQLPAGNFTTGAYDFAYNIVADPTVALGKGLKLTHKAMTVVKPGADLDKVLASTGTRKFLDRLFSLQTQEQRTRWLFQNTSVAPRDNPASAAMVDLLSKAKDRDEARAILTLALTPDGTGMAYARLSASSRDAAAKFDYLTDTRIPLLQKSLQGETNTFQRAWGKRTIEAAKAEADANAQLAKLEAARAAVAGNVFTAKPRLTLSQELAEGFRGLTTEFVAPSLYNLPVRWVRASITKRPGVVNFHEPDAWVEIGRYLRQAGVDDDTQGKILSRWNDEAAKGVNEAGKRRVAEMAEDAAKKAVARRFKLNPDMIDAAFDHARKMRSRFARQMQDPAYTSITRDGRYIDMISDDGHMERWPLFLTQVANYHALLEVQDVVRVLGRYKSELRGREHDLWGALHAVRSNQKVIGMAEGMEEIAQAIHNVWKPAVLVSARYVIRNVTDEMLRTVATFGVVSALRMSRSSIVGRHAEKQLARNLQELTRISNQLDLLTRNGGDPGLINQLRKTKQELEVKTTGVPTLFGAPQWVRGIEVEGLYGGPGASPLRAAVSARDTMRQLATDQGTMLARMRAEWSPSIEPSDPNYPGAWERAVNDQIRDDPVGKMLLAGDDDARILRWLSSPEGRDYSSRVGRRFTNRRRWIEQQRLQVNTYVPTPELQELAHKRKLKHSDLEKVISDPAIRPVVHGQNLEIGFGKSRVVQGYHHMIERVMDSLGAAPNDVLLRHPFANLSYLSKMDELLRYSVPPGTKVDAAVLTRLQTQARLHARRKVQETLYDLAEQPNIGRSVRFIMPFYGAWNDFLTRWMKIFVDDPSRLGRAAQVWTAPERAGILQDTERGEVIVLPMPQAVRDRIPGAAALGDMAFTREDLLGITSGPYPLLPGSGPLVAIPIAAYARNRPDLTESLRFLLPYGPGDSPLDQLAPAWIKRFAESGSVPGFDAKENRSFSVWKSRITAELIYERNVGKNSLSDTELVAEADRRAHDFYALRAVVNLAVPAPDYASPYQFYWDKATEYRQRYADKPGEWEGHFLADFGDEFFPFTAAMSKSLTGITPTKEGFKVSEQFADLIARYPEHGGLIAGDLDDSGEFSQAVYEWQFRARIGPGDTRTHRQVTNPGEMIDDLNRSRGWRAWMAGSELITEEMRKRGIVDLTDPRGADLAEYKRALRVALAAQYPTWYADYAEMTSDAAGTVMKLSEFAFDSRFDDRMGFRSLRDYITARKELVTILQARDRAGGSANLQAGGNEDLATVWKAFVGQMVQTDIGFAQIYDRYLDGDLIPRGI